MFEQWEGWEYNDCEENPKSKLLSFYLLEQHKHLQQTLKNQAKHLISFCFAVTCGRYLSTYLRYFLLEEGDSYSYSDLF